VPVRGVAHIRYDVIGSLTRHSQQVPFGPTVGSI
jgi:hypothetical protein